MVSYERFVWFLFKPYLSSLDASGRLCFVIEAFLDTVELQWREHLWDHGDSFETLVVRAKEG